MTAMQAVQTAEGGGDVTPATSSILQQVTKAPMLITKAGDKLTMVTTSMAGQQPQTAGGVITAPHLLQSTTLSGKPAAFGGNPIIIGGKQALLSGKPLQIGGTSLQLIGKPGGQLGMVQGLSAGVSTVNVVTQV